MPKGVMYPQGDITERLVAALAALRAMPSVPAAREDVARFVTAVNEQGVEAIVPCCPLMHGTGMWIGAMPALVGGGTVVLLEGRSFDAHEVWRVIEREIATRIVIVGDPFARPMLRALEERETAGQPYDTSNVRSITSSGAIWSSEIKDGLRTRMSAILIDTLGSTKRQHRGQRCQS